MTPITMRFLMEGTFRRRGYEALHSVGTYARR